MIQRIQTVYYILVISFALLFLFLPLATLRTGELTSSVILISGSPAQENFAAGYASLFRSVLQVLSFLCVAFTTYIVFQYRKRIYQIKLGRVNIMLHLVVLVVSFFYLDQLKDALPESTFSYGAGVFLPLVSLLLIFRANRAIIRDEKLVRAADRIR